MEPSEFIDLLKSNGIQLLIDVRSVPYSKYASQFNRETISSRIQNETIEYLYLGDKVGGKPSDESFYKDKMVCYHLIEEDNGFKEGLKIILSRASCKKTVLMCSEENPYRCHRHNLISQNLLKKGFKVVHLRRNGQKEIAIKKDVQLKLF
ncbi:DUF488 family protein [Methanobacterium aggregans]|uniref:DUF488 domain-containing protein n=1 Tax=Methanobacterium aggregans TaxID=1615586 RepID=UPI001AEB89AE|nr:DUF488 domain-containing protein [Methanobacterium aggregans]MBP2046490.1 uncharacterized protein (DUF488 family) [Methanobacterium aggregans]